MNIRMTTQNNNEFYEGESECRRINFEDKHKYPSEYKWVDYNEFKSLKKILTFTEESNSEMLDFYKRQLKHDEFGK